MASTQTAIQITDRVSAPMYNIIGAFGYIILPALVFPDTTFLIIAVLERCSCFWISLQFRITK